MALSNNIMNNQKALHLIKWKLGGKFDTLMKATLYSAFNSTIPNQNDVINEVKTGWNAMMLCDFFGDKKKLKDQLKDWFTDRNYPLIRKIENGTLVIFYPKFQENGGVFNVLYRNQNAGFPISTPLFEEFNVEDFEDQNNGKIPYFIFTGTLFKTKGQKRKQNGYVYSSGIRRATEVSELPEFRGTMSMQFSKSDVNGLRFKFNLCDSGCTDFYKYKDLDPGDDDEKEKELDVNGNLIILNSQKRDTCIFQQPYHGVSEVSPPFEGTPEVLPREGEGLGGLYPILHKKDGVIYKVVGVELPTEIKPDEIRGFQYDLLKRKDPRVGKCIFSVNQNNDESGLKDSLCVFLQLDGLSSFPIDKIRNRLFELGYEDSVGMDGSGSAFVYDVCGSFEFSEDILGRPKYMNSMVVIGGVIS